MIQGNGFSIKESKFDYFFGRVTSNPSNQKRSLQNLEDLKKLGIDEARGGREQLMKVFQDGLNSAEVKRITTEYGTIIVKKVEVASVESKGAIEISYFYPGSNLSAVPEVSSIIPKIYC
ncbi:hypothetical protein VB711_20615 [Cronbergia sp. UHCC 0137]|uniref:hypothetical protein n=1 Tax=Cronbergia sp. UHCC 0137 TaxID=3110239 RepID=UPI002B1EEFEF|nr:hypothetical protein [Cronbergia sp. UHCC 0137]MEA5620230.1 hypothetical protein [Cronbergia sp. UHCC 0137]